MVTLPWPPILIITDRTQCAETLEARATALFRGGCRWLSLREKDMEPTARLELLKRLIAIAADFGAVVGVHDDPAAAEACRCALHLPAGSNSGSARALLGKDALLGKSCHDRADFSELDGADYVTLGPVFASASKPGYPVTLDTAAFAAAVAEADLPVLALGGVTAATLPGLAATGISGVAIMGEAMTTPDPRAWFAGIASAWTRPAE